MAPQNGLTLMALNITLMVMPTHASDILPVERASIMQTREMALRPNPGSLSHLRRRSKKIFFPNQFVK